MFRSRITLFAVILLGLTLVVAPAFTQPSFYPPRSLYRANSADGVELYRPTFGGQWESVHETLPNFVYSYTETARTPAYIELWSNHGNHAHVRLYNGRWYSWTGSPQGWMTWPDRTGFWLR